MTLGALVTTGGALLSPLPAAAEGLCGVRRGVVVSLGLGREEGSEPGSMGDDSARREMNYRCGTHVVGMATIVHIGATKHSIVLDTIAFDVQLITQL